jgi:hypothetical protein
LKLTPEENAALKRAANEVRELISVMKLDNPEWK